MSSAELTEWRAFDRLEPFGDQRADLRAGIVASTVANFSARPPKDGLKPSDFMLFAKDEPDKPVLLDPEAQARLIKQSIFRVKE